MPVIEVSTIHHNRNICCCTSVYLKVSLLTSEIYLLSLNQGKYVSVYRFGLSVAGRKITEPSPQHIGMLKTPPQVTDQS